MPQWKHFTLDEFACNCGVCKDNHTSHKLITILDIAREASGVAYIINRGYSCLAHNRTLGSKDTSCHPKGEAADIKANTPEDRFNILKGLFIAKIPRIIIYPTFIHVSINPYKPQGITYLNINGGLV